MIISINADISFDKICCLFIIERINKLDIEETCLNITKAIYHSPVKTLYVVGKTKSIFSKISYKFARSHPSSTGHT